MKSKVKLIDMTSDKIYLNKDCSSTKKIINMFKTKAQIVYYKLDNEINFKNLKLEDINQEDFLSMLKEVDVRLVKVTV